MKRTFLFIVCCFVAITLKAQLNAVPGAYFHPYGYLNMVPSPYTTAYKSGAGWSPFTVDFNKSFVVDFDAVFKWHKVDVEIPPPAQKGFVMVFGSNINNSSITGTLGGTVGADMGYYQTTPTTDFLHSIGIEVDITDDGTPYNDMIHDHHIMITRNAWVGTAFGTGAVNASPSSPNIEDGITHHYRVVYDCRPPQTISVYFDGVFRASSYVTPGLDFSVPSAVYWGFTAAREGQAAWIILSNVVMQQSDKCANCAESYLQFDFLGCSHVAGNPDYHVAVTPVYGLPSGYSLADISIDMGDGHTISMGITPMSALYTYHSPGSYTVVMTIKMRNEYGDECIDVITAHVYIPDCFSLENADEFEGWKGPRPQTNAAAKNITVTPNPTTGKFTVAAGGTTFNNISITDIAGRTIFTETYDEVTNKTIDIHGFNNGVYTVNITTADGQHHVSKIVLTK